MAVREELVLDLTQALAQIDDLERELDEEFGSKPPPEATPG